MRPPPSWSRLPQWARRDRHQERLDLLALQRFVPITHHDRTITNEALQPPPYFLRARQGW